MAVNSLYGRPARASRLTSPDNVADNICKHPDQERFSARLYLLEESSMEIQARIENAERDFIATVNLAALKHVRTLREIRADQRRLTSMLREAA